MNRPEFKPPKTTRVYLHQPYSERLVMMFPDFKITNLELSENNGHYDQIGTGFIILHGDNPEALDFCGASFAPVTGGTPIYKLRSSGEYECDITLEAFCSFGRNPLTYARVTVSNNNNYPMSGKLAVLPRTSPKEHYQTNLVSTGYGSYRPNVRNWYMVKSDWHETGANTVSDGTASLKIKTPLASNWVPKTVCYKNHEASDYYSIAYFLEGGECAAFDICFSLASGELPEDINYDSEKEKIVARWN